MLLKDFLGRVERNTDYGVGSRGTVSALEEPILGIERGSRDSWMPCKGGSSCYCSCRPATLASRYDDDLTN